MTNNDVKWGVPENVKFCSRCVISNQRPGTSVEFKHNDQKQNTISFTDQVCDACRYHDYKYNEVDWGKREDELRRLCDIHRRGDGSHDVLVPASGGKDSSYVAHKLKHKYGMNPLSITWAPHIYTDIGRKNLDAFIASGFDNISLTPNAQVHAQLTSLAFKNLLHPFQPFMLGQKNVAPRYALQSGIKFIMYGESQAEGGSKVRWDDPKMPTDFFSVEKSRRHDSKISGLSLSELSHNGITASDLELYLPLDKAKIDEAGLEQHFFSYYEKWVPQENFYYAVEHCGFTPNPTRSEGTFSKYASLDDRIDGFHYYTTFVKFGIGRATYDASQEIRNGHIDREEAMALVRQYDGEFPEKYFREFLDYIAISEDEFWEKIDAGRSTHLWEKVSGEWRLKHRVYD